MAVILPQSFDTTFTTATPLPAFVTQALNCTRELMWLYWAGATELCLQYVDDRTQFIGPLSEYPAVGRTAISAAMSELRAVTPSRYIMSSEHYSSTLLDTNSCSITAQCVLERQANAPVDDPLGQHANPPAPISTTVLSTLAWANEGTRMPRLVICHCSVAPLQPMQASDAGVHTGALSASLTALTQRGEAGLMRLGEGTLQTIDSNGISHWVYPKSVVYAKAAHQYTDIYCVGRRLRIRSSFNTALEQLGNTVVRVHRSYAVNPAYLSYMKDQTLYLTTGDQIPIPSNRRREVRQLLLEHSSKLGSRG